MHEQVAVISFCVAFRHQLIQKYETEEALRQYLGQIPDPSRAAVLEDVVFNGMGSPRLALAVYAYNKLIADLDTALGRGDWIVGSKVSLADFSFLPYIERLEQLQLAQWWRERPAISRWLERVRETSAYTRGVADWQNANYMKLMAELGKEAWSGISALL